MVYYLLEFILHTSADSIIGAVIYNYSDDIKVFPALIQNIFSVEDEVGGGITILEGGVSLCL